VGGGGGDAGVALLTDEQRGRMEEMIANLERAKQQVRQR
jgi:mevalonate kinase